MTGELAGYGPGGTDTDYVAKDIRRLTGRRVNVFDFMSTAQVNSIKARNYSFDSSSYVQQAIDYAVANYGGDIEMPPGGYRWDNPVYLDPIGNLRSSLSTPTVFSMSLGLFGGGGWGGYGTTSGVEVRTYTSSGPAALYVGPGQAMYVGGIAFGSFVSGSPMNRANDCGLMISGGSGGASKVLIERCRATNYSIGFGVGFNNDALGESVTWFKCMADLCNQGWSAASSQAFILNLIECQGQNNNDHVYSAQFPQVQVIGGNFSNGLALFAVSNCGTFTNFNNSTHEFQATITSNTTNWPYFDTATFDCGDFGFVPCDVVSYNSGTGVATFRLRKWFRNFNQFAYDLTATPLKPAIQSCTKVYAAKKTRIFYGKIFAKGVHIESTTGPMVALYSTGTDATAASLENCFFNADPAFSTYAGLTNGEESKYYTQLALGLVETVGITSGFTLKETSFGQSLTTDPINIVYETYVPSVARIEDCVCLAGVNELGQLGYYNIGEADNQRSSNVKGGAIYDSPPNFGNQRSSTELATYYYTPYRTGNMPFYGNRPAPWATPRLSSANLASLIAASSPSRSLPVLHPEPYYNISDGTGTYLQYAFAKISGGTGWTYGSQLTGLNYAYVGGGHALKFTTGIDWMFVGLEIGISGRWYIVNAVFPSLKLVHVQVADSEFSGSTQLPGTAGTTYSGNTTLDQRPFNIRKFGRQVDFSSSVPASGTWVTGDLWNNPAPAIGSPAQAWNASGGAPGTWIADRLLSGAPQNNVAAAGTNQGTATALTYSEIINCTSVGSGTGIKLPAAKADMRMFVRNSGGFSLTVYPTGSETINGTASVSVAISAGKRFFAVEDGKWITD